MLMEQRNISSARIVLAVYVLGFSLGIAKRGHDFLTHGWRPYRWGVLPLEAFWTALILLDAGDVALLLAGWRRSGLLAALIIMTCDVGANSYALFVMGIQMFAGPLVLQAAFFGFIMGSIAFLWPKSETSL
jgi:hypothetical protein